MGDKSSRPRHRPWVVLKVLQSCQTLNHAQSPELLPGWFLLVDWQTAPYLAAYFDNVQHSLLLEKVARRVQDDAVREIFRQHVSWPVETVIVKVNPVLGGWVNYFRIGHSSSCFTLVKEWVERKIRRHLMRARGRQGFGWKRWSSA
jgi:hypothetical protein